MDNLREKLVKLLREFSTPVTLNGEKLTDWYIPLKQLREVLADYLITHGVRLEEKQLTSDENKRDVPDILFGKWIPVEERKPELIPCSAGTAYSEAVNALTSGRKVITAIWDGEDFIGDAEFWEAGDEVITHWTPVLLPLPEPPKEE